MKTPSNLPVECLDRMTDAILSHDFVELKGEVQHFWRNDWKISQVPDPKDQDPLRYAIKASVLERLVQVWNFKIQNSNLDQKQQRSPRWCKSVPKVPRLVPLIDEKNLNIYKDDHSPVFMKRNLLAPRETLMFF